MAGEAPAPARPTRAVPLVLGVPGSVGLRAPGEPASRASAAAVLGVDERAAGGGELPRRPAIARVHAAPPNEPAGADADGLAAPYAEAAPVHEAGAVEASAVFVAKDVGTAGCALGVEGTSAQQEWSRAGVTRGVCTGWSRTAVTHAAGSAIVAHLSGRHARESASAVAQSR